MPKKKDEGRRQKAEGIYEQARRLGLRYVGQNGDHITGIQAADIAPDRVALIGPRRIEMVLASGLYELCPLIPPEDGEGDGE